MKDAQFQLVQLKQIEKDNYKTVEQLKNQLSRLKSDNKNLTELKEKEKAINDAWEKLSDLQSKQTEIGNRIYEYQKMFDFFESMDEFYYHSMVPIVSSITTKQINEQILVKAQSILNNIENWSYAFKLKYKLQSSSEIINQQ